MFQPLAAVDLSGPDLRGVGPDVEMEPPETEGAETEAAETDAAGRRARRRAVDAGKAAFLRTVGHELRTPLNSIIGFSEIIAREMYGRINEPRYREHAEIVRDSGLRLLKMVNQVMDIVRLESGAMEFDPQPIPLSQVFEDAVRAVADEAAARRIRFNVQVRGQVRGQMRGQVRGAAPGVTADARALTSVLAALIQNAVAHAPEGSAVVLAGRVAGRHAVLEVRDAGPGVPPDQIARLLRPFEQGAGDALTRHGEGAGLGLAVSRLLCEAMDGRLRLAPAPEGGLMATVRLPAG